MTFLWKEVSALFLPWICPLQESSEIKIRDWMQALNDKDPLSPWAMHEKSLGETMMKQFIGSIRYIMELYHDGKNLEMKINTVKL